MAGLLDKFMPATTAPQPTLVPLDPGTNSLIDQSVARGQQSTQQFADQQNAGVNQAATQGYGQTPQQAEQHDQSMGYSGADGAMNSAIRNQYRADSGATINRLKDAYSQQAVFQKSQALQQASAQAMARQKVTTQSYSTLMNAYNQTEAARAQVLNSILGAGGMVGGSLAARQRGARPTAQPMTPANETTTIGAGYGDYASNDSAIA